MARGKRVELDTIHFENQTLALEFFKEILNRYIPGEHLNAEDARHAASLFKRHPDYHLKQGTPFVHYAVMAADYGSQCFCGIRADGTKEDFSYKRCVTRKAD